MNSLLLEPLSSGANSHFQVFSPVLCWEVVRSSPKSLAIDADVPQCRAGARAQPFAQRAVGPPLIIQWHRAAGAASSL